MDAWATLAILSGAFSIGLAGTWLSVLAGRETYPGGRRKASLASLVLPSVALAVLFAISAIAYFHPLNEMDDVSLRGGWHAVADVLWLCAHFATGVLPICGIVSAMLGIGR